jgi:phenylacetate-CoA ligase
MIDAPQGAVAQALAMQFRLQQTETLPVNVRSELQNKALQSLLSHALSTVPYYRDHPQIKNIGNSINWLDFPVLTRSSLQSNSQQLKSEQPPKAHGKQTEFRSSGSTGRPVHTFNSEYAQIFWRAMTVRDHIWAKRDFSKKLAVIKFLATGESLYPGASASVWGPSTSHLGYQGPSAILNSSESTEIQYKWLSEQKPDYLLTYPSALHDLAKLQLRTKQISTLKGISTLGENLSDETRTLVQNAFGCRIHDIYSSQEVGYIALQCPKHDHYHVQSETCLVEILDEQGKPCTPGTLGRVVVTSFQNYVMPLIRYDIGDYAIAGNQCDCGITLPVLSRIAGRTRNLVTYPDGRRSWPAYNPMALMELLPDARFQLEQTAPKIIVLRVQTVTKLTEELKQKIIHIVQTAMGYPFTIGVQQVDDIPRAASGKYEEFKSVL